MWGKRRWHPSHCTHPVTVTWKKLADHEDLDKCHQSSLLEANKIHKQKGPFWVWCHSQEDTGLMPFPPLSLHRESSIHSPVYLQQCSVPLPASILVPLASPSCYHQALCWRRHLPWIVFSVPYVQTRWKNFHRSIFKFSFFLFRWSKHFSRLLVLPFWRPTDSPVRRVSTVFGNITPSTFQATI